MKKRNSFISAMWKKNKKIDVGTGDLWGIYTQSGKKNREAELAWNFFYLFYSLKKTHKSSPQ